MLEWSRPLRQIDILGVQPFDGVLSSLAGPVIRSTKDWEGAPIAYAPTPALFIILGVLFWPKITTSFKVALQDFKNRDRE